MNLDHDVALSMQFVSDRSSTHVAMHRENFFIMADMSHTMHLPAYRITYMTDL